MVPSEKKCLEELESPETFSELKNIILNMTFENPISHTLFKGKYQILLLEKILPWQKPFGEIFKSTLVVCGVKLKKLSSAYDTNEEELQSPEEEEEEDDDDCGSPLSVVFESFISQNMHLSHSVIKQLKERFILYPLSQNIGRKILSVYNTMAGNEIKFPLITLCHDRNPKAAVLIGTSKQEKFTRVLVTNQGSVSKQEQLPKLNIVELSHLQGFEQTCTSIKTSVFARYDILGVEEESELQPCKNMNVIMDCYWSNATSILEPVSIDCTCFAKIKTVDGDNESGAFTKFKEVNLIMALQEALDTNVMKWPSASSDGKLLEKIQDFLNSERSLSSQREKVMSVLPDFESFDLIVLQNCRDLDFTDKLWLILKECSSCEELMDALIFVFKELSGFSVPLFVHSKNISTISLAIKNMRVKPVVCPPLDFHLAMKMLLEIGVEKLRKDYCAIFTGLELAPYDCISYFLRPESVSLEGVTCLRKLHTVLELAVICLKCLNFSKQLLNNFIRNALKHYMSVTDVDLQHIFKFEVPSAKARYLLNQMRPTIWEISLVTSSKDYLKQTILHYSTTPTPDHVYAPKDYHPKLMLKDASYVFVTATLVQK